MARASLSGFEGPRRLYLPWSYIGADTPGITGLVDLVLASVTALPAALAALMCYGISTSIGNVAF